MSKVLMISIVQDDSQAKRLGLKPGDVITSYDGAAISSNTELLNAEFDATNNNKETVEIVIVRDGGEVKLMAAPEPLGVICEEVGKDKEVDAVAPANESAGKIRYKTEYGVARGVSSAVSFIGWVLVLAGVAALLMAVASGMNSQFGSVSWMAVLPGLGAVVSGFLLIMGAQVTRATVDNADHTREILKEMSRR